MIGKYIYYIRCVVLGAMLDGCCVGGMMCWMVAMLDGCHVG